MTFAQGAYTDELIMGPFDGLLLSRAEPLTRLEPQTRRDAHHLVPSNSFFQPSGSDWRGHPLARVRVTSA